MNGYAQSGMAGCGTVTIRGAWIGAAPVLATGPSVAFVTGTPSTLVMANPDMSKPGNTTIMNHVISVSRLLGVSLVLGADRTSSLSVWSAQICKSVYAFDWEA